MGGPHESKTTPSAAPPPSPKQSRSNPPQPPSPSQIPPSDPPVAQCTLEPQPPWTHTAPAHQRWSSTLALTGPQYLDSLDDGRAIWIDGARVDRVPDHPAFRLPARTLADLYDSLHQGVETLTWTTERGALSHRAFRIAHTRQHLRERAEAMRIWAERHYGFLGRAPDYKGGLAQALAADPTWYGPFASNAQRWAERITDRVEFVNHVGVHPMVDRSKAPHELPDVNVRSVRERDDGFIVQGAKIIGTAAAFTHSNLVFSAAALPPGEKDRDQALVFFVPTGSPGLHVLCRRSYAAAATHAFDHPLSARFDENDATLVFDDVFVPWENALVYRDVQKASEFFVRAQLVQNLMLHGAVRFATKVRFLVGLLLRMVETAGSADFRAVRVHIGEILGWLWTFEALVRDACEHPDPGPNGTLAPSHRTIFAARSLAPAVYPRIREAMLLLGAGGLMQLPSSAEDLRLHELRPFIDRYFRGTGVDGEGRIKLWKLAWDAIGSEFGARHELFERTYAGSFDNVRIDNLFLAEHDGDRARCTDLVDRALSDYDLEGWKRAPWAGAGDGSGPPARAADSDSKGPR